MDFLTFYHNDALLFGVVTITDIVIADDIAFDNSVRTEWLTLAQSCVVAQSNITYLTLVEGRYILGTGKWSPWFLIYVGRTALQMLAVDCFLIDQCVSAVGG